MWGEKALEQEVRTEYVVSTKLFSDLPGRFSYTLDSSPVMVICSRWVGWSRFPLWGAECLPVSQLMAFVASCLGGLP